MAKTREQMKEWYRNYAPMHREAIRAYNRKSYLKYKDEIREKYRQRCALLKDEFIAAYGGKCTCCGEVHREFLTLEHTNNNGAEERKQLNGQSGVKFYMILKKRGWPQEGYTLLCFNCNCARYYFGRCPHEVE